MTTPDVSSHPHIDDICYLGGEVKALGNGRVGGYLVRFGTVDVQGDLFDPGADYGLEVNPKAPVYYHHGLRRRGDKHSESIHNRRIGVGEVKALDDGLWIEATLDLSKPPVAELYAEVEAGRMGWSSGTSDRFVRFEPIEIKGRRGRRITAWPLNDASLTPTPVESRNRAITLKALLGVDDTEHPGPDADAAPRLVDSLSKLVADAEGLLPIATKAATQRREAGRNLSRSKLDAIKAVADTFAALHRGCLVLDEDLDLDLVLLDLLD